MKYSYKNIHIIKELLEKETFISKCRRKETNYIRKIGPQDIILYELNKKGLSSKMEIINFNNINNVKNISSPNLFKQRKKLNPETFIYLMQESLKEFYWEYKNEVKTYKGYVLTGIDGSDFEVQNTKSSREKYNGT